MASGPGRRLAHTVAHLSGQSTHPERWDPDNNEFPTFQNLPKIEGAPEGAAWFWGEDDQLGRINLLTPRRVKKAIEEVQTGEIIPLNLPLDTPKVPAFGRQEFRHEILPIIKDRAYDDKYDLNTQSGTQWDGFRHFSHLKSKKFYNGTTSADIHGPQANRNGSIEHIAQHGIAGRGVLLDYATYSDAQGIRYDPFEHYEISFDSLMACARAQGLDPRPKAQGGDLWPGDLLFIRSGWTRHYNKLSPVQRETAARREVQNWAGVAQERAMIEWLHDCYFAAVAGDAPSFEAWPPKQKIYLHEYLLALWGMPIGEMWDLDRLSERCRGRGCWTFFVTSAPANCPNGVSSHGNAMAII